MPTPSAGPTPTVVITGAASGIGRSAAIRFAASGWRCVLVDRNGKALESLQRELRGVHEVRRIDLTDPAQIRSLTELADPIDAVVNNAGMSDTSGTPLCEQAPERQAMLMALNLEAPAAIVIALESRLAPRARIVNIASSAGLRAIPFRGLYSATKAGLIAQSRALARARPELIVTVLCPGFVRTELVDGLIAAGRLDPRRAVAKTPLGRMAEPAEMAEAMCFLASPDAAPLHGQVISLCGGSSIYGGSQACEPATSPPLPLDAALSMTVTGDSGGAWSGWLAGDGVSIGCESTREGPTVGRGTSTPATSTRATSTRGTSTRGTNSYPAVVDVSALGAARPTASGPPGGRPGNIVVAVHEAARRFAQWHSRDASLTVLLPASVEVAGTAGRADDGFQRGDWQNAGDAAAARMLVATLACELAPRALRVNAIEVGAGMTPERIRPLLHYVAGARAQYLTGQTLQATAR